ncbi:uncharacterized protein N7511_003149 [Penicillium nucicola]|uniref:uncharacterized protein n=1 Tax=Penicillium nucicola TaxID=1850975 RepID=UPI002545AF04|nr:uncharacterized protein N7511_003149 [Penicillium nucicola]KAJ5771098.1 hypothetical protein N7511_003149 [Penicillium nucicola]
MKIVIIGAGIAGCAAYLELQKHLQTPTESDEEHDIMICEAYSTDLDVSANERKEEHTHSSTLLVGGGLGVGPNGLNVLRRLDETLLKDVVRGGYTISTSNMKSKNGWQLVKMKNTSLDNNDNNPESMCMVATSRHSFWQALRSRIPDEHIINKRISEVVVRTEEKNLIQFADGTPPLEADLVIGADGVQSTAKRALFPDTKDDPYPPHYEGLVGVGGFIPASDVQGLVEKGSMNFIFGGNGFFGYFYSESAKSAVNRDSPYHVSEPGDSLAWWSTYEIEECPDRQTLDMADVTRQLRERHADWKDPVVRKIIQSLHVENMYPTWTSPVLPTWERGGVVLVGDAAHALPPSSGQGSSQALEDVEAFVLFLAHYLRKHGANDHSSPESQKGAIRVAAQQYTSLRQPRVKEILEFAQKTQNRKRQMGLFQEYSMYTFMKFIGLFPSLLDSQIRKVSSYNIAEEVAKVLVTEK